MTTEEANANIGKPFKYELCAHWDTIVRVTMDGYIIGNFIMMAPVENCRLKQDIPEGLKNYQQQKEK